MRDVLPLEIVAAGPSCVSAPSMPTYRWRPSGVTAAASNARFWRTPCVALVGRNAAGTGRSPRNAPPSEYRRTNGGIPCHGDALRRHDQLAVLRQREPLRVEAGRRVRPAAGRLQRGDAGERDVAVGELAVGDVDLQRVEAGRIDLALVVGQAVVDAARGVVGDAREPADRGAGEGRARRDDRPDRGTAGSAASCRCRCRCSRSRRGQPLLRLRPPRRPRRRRTSEFRSLNPPRRKSCEPRTLVGIERPGRPR